MDLAGRAGLMEGGNLVEAVLQIRDSDEADEMRDSEATSAGQDCTAGMREDDSDRCSGAGEEGVAGPRGAQARASFSFGAAPGS